MRKLQFICCSALLIAAAPWAPAADSAKPDQGATRAWIARLASDDFSKREAAKATLAKLGERALPELRAAAQKSKDPQIRRAAQMVIRSIYQRSIRLVKTIGSHQGEGYRRWATRATITSDGNHLITGGNDSIRVWNLKTGKAVRSFGGRVDCWSVHLSPDESQLATGGDRKVRLWDWKTGAKIGEFDTHTKAVWGVRFLPDGKRFASVAKDAKLITHQIAPPKPLKTVALPDKTRGLELMPDGKSGLVIVSSKDSAPSTVELWDLENGKMRQKFSGHKGSPTSITLSSDGKRMVSGAFDKSIRIWDVATGKELRKLSGHTANVEDIVFTPGDRYLLSCANRADPTLCLWDPKSGKLLWRSAPQPAGLLSITFLPGGKQFVVTSKDGSVKLWSFALGGEDP